MEGVPGREGKGRILWLMDVGVLGVFVPDRYCSIFCSSVGWAAFENPCCGDGYEMTGEVGDGDMDSGESLRGEDMERLSTERDQPLRERLRRSPVPLDPVDVIVPTRSVLARDDKSSTDL